MAIEVKPARPELAPAAAELTALLRRFLSGKTTPLASRLVGLALEVQVVEEEHAAALAELEQLRQQPAAEEREG